MTSSKKSNVPRPTSITAHLCEDRLAQLPAHGERVGKEAGLELEEVKTLLRHENLATTSEVYGDLGMEAKRRIQQQLVNFVKQQATRIQ
jgi:hypothetical protein